MLFKNKRLLFFSLFLSFYLNTYAFAEPCFPDEHPLADLELSEEHLIDLLKVCFNKGGLDCRVLTRKIGGKTQLITLIGENHVNGQQEFQQVSNLFRHYRTVGLESSPNLYRYGRPPLSTPAWWEFPTPPRETKVYSGAPYPFSIIIYEQTLKKEDPQRIVYLEEGFEGRIEIGGQVFDPPSSAWRRNMFQGSRAALWGASCYAVGSCFSTLTGQDNFLTILGSTLTVAGIAQIGVGLLQTKHDDVLKNDDIRYNSAKPRDSFMARNLLFGLKSSPDSRIAGGMGARHVFGVSYRLEKRGFIDRSEDILDLYKMIKHSSVPGCSDEMADTVFRDLKKPFSSGFSTRLFGERTLERIKELYPEIKSE